MEYPILFPLLTNTFPRVYLGPAVFFSERSTHMAHAHGIPLFTTRSLRKASQSVRCSRCSGSHLELSLFTIMPSDTCVRCTWLGVLKAGFVLDERYTPWEADDPTYSKMVGMLHGVELYIVVVTQWLPYALAAPPRLKKRKRISYWRLSDRLPTSIPKRRCVGGQKHNQCNVSTKTDLGK